ncbi:hypothetical protein [Bradyrhizobium sp. SZCCHNR2028]|uniref:HAD family hydrolase n=1 Tax=Bradyrhizobium sp. SZCCHNR2028 TaxID=3057382 RepID=UPI0028E99D39|nr:hypothetical protein [Bradyrhizobium sp. SZCCHNR2028]
MQSDMDAELQSRLDDADVVSFDVFDTSILRALAEPDDLFLLMEPAVRRRLGADSIQFAAARRDAERLARERAWQSHRAREVTLDEIYDTLSESLAIDSELSKAVAQMEIEAELDVCRRNPFIHDAYRWCRDRGKRIAFISDSYLPEHVIADLLRNAGYDGHEALLVSSVSKKTKSTGELHAEARARLPGEGQRWLHIGDNVRADIEMGRKHGMSTWHYRRCMDAYMSSHRASKVWKTSEPASAARSVAQGLIANRITHARRNAVPVSREESFWEDFGYVTAGPLFVGFTEWLIEQAKARQLDALYFLAREGLVMQQVYDKLAAATDGAVKETHYLYGSRRALNVAAIKDLNEDVIRFLSGGTSVLTAAQFIERAGVDWRKHEGAFGAAGFSGPDHEVKTEADYGRLRQLFLGLAGPICENAREEREVLLDYLSASGLVGGRRVGLIDVGWHGTMQRSITDMLRERGDCPEITGLYLGTYGFAHEIVLPDEKYPHDAYLFRRGEPDDYRRLIWEGVEVVELLFSATEGTIVRIERDVDGNYFPVRASTDLEPYRVESIVRMQQGAMQFVDDYLALKVRFPDLALSKDAAAAQLKRFLQYPTEAEARHVGDIPHGEGFGAVYARRLLAYPHSLRMLARPQSFRWVLRHDYWHAGRNRRGSPVQRAVYWLLTR